MSADLDLQSIENCLPDAPVGLAAGQEAVEVRAVVVVAEMTQFVHDDIFDAVNRHLDEADVEGYSAGRGATSPAPFHLPYA